MERCEAAGHLLSKLFRGCHVRVCRRYVHALVCPQIVCVLILFAGTFKGELTSEQAINEYCIGRRFDEYLAMTPVRVPSIPPGEIETYRKEVRWCCA